MKLGGKPSRRPVPFTRVAFVSPQRPSSSSSSPSSFVPKKRSPSPVGVQVQLSSAQKKPTANSPSAPPAAAPTRKATKGTKVTKVKATKVTKVTTGTVTLGTTHHHNNSMLHVSALDHSWSLQNQQQHQHQHQPHPGPSYQLPPPMNTPPLGVNNNSVFRLLRDPNCDISWVEVSCRQDPTINMLWERFLALQQRGPFLLDEHEAARTRSSLSAYMLTSFTAVDDAWLHYYRLFLISSLKESELLNLCRTFNHLTNIDAATALRMGSTHVVLRNPLRRRRATPGVVISSTIPATTSSAMTMDVITKRWGMNEAALLTEMLMSSGTVRSISIESGSASSSQLIQQGFPEKSSVFAQSLGAILASNPNINTLEIHSTFRFNPRTEGNPIGLQRLLHAMDMTRGVGTSSRLIRLVITAGCGARRDGQKKQKNMEEMEEEALYSSFGEHNGYATIRTEEEDEEEEGEEKMEKKKKKKKKKEIFDTSQLPGHPLPPEEQRLFRIREAHWSAVATLLVEGVTHCKTMRVVSIEGCHLVECSSVLLPAVAKMLRLTAGFIHTVRLPGCNFPSSRGRSPKKRRKHSSTTSSVCTKIFCNAVSDCTSAVVGKTSLTSLDISHSTIGSSASIMLAKAAIHLTNFEMESLVTSSVGLRAFVKLQAEQSKTMNVDRLVLCQRAPARAASSKSSPASLLSIPTTITPATTKRKKQVVTQKSKLKSISKKTALLKKGIKNNSKNVKKRTRQQDEGVLLRTVEATRARAGSLLVLNLQWMCLGQRGGVSLASSLRACTKMTSLDVTGNNMKSVGCSALFQSILPSFGRNLQLLKMGHNMMGDSAAHAMCRLLESAASLETLYLDHNLLTTDSLSLIFSTSVGLGLCPSLVDIDVSYNQMDSTLCVLRGYLTARRAERRAESIAAVGAVGVSLERLSLRGNLLTESSAKMLSDILQLTYSDDEQKQEEEQRRKRRREGHCGKHMGEDLSTTMLLRSGPLQSPRRRMSSGGIPSASLTSLDLSANVLGAEGGAHLGQGLRCSMYLKVLLLCGCSLGSVGTLSIAQGLLENKKLERLDLSENLICCDIRRDGHGTFGLELRAMCVLSEVLRSKGTKLTSLLLCENQVGKSGSELLREAILMNRCLTLLDLRGNEGIESGTLKTIARRLEDNARYRPPRFTSDICSSSSSGTSSSSSTKLLSKSLFSSTLLTSSPPPPTAPRALSSYLSPAEKAKYKQVVHVSPPRSTLDSLNESSLRVKDEDEDEDDEMFAEILFGAKQQGEEKRPKSTGRRETAPPPMLRTPPPSRSSSSRLVSPLGVPSMNKAARIVCHEDEAVDQEALRKAIERLKLMTQ